MSADVTYMEGYFYTVSNIQMRYNASVWEDKWWIAVKTSLSWEELLKDMYKTIDIFSVSEIKRLKTTITKEGLNHFVFELVP